MRRLIVNVFAVIGALTVLGSVAAFSIHHLTYRGATGVVLGPGDKPANGVSVFLDRGGPAIERYVTDSTGYFRLPLDWRELRRAIWLICVPGGIPYVGTRDVGQIGSTTYGFTAQPPGRSTFLRARGWHGPIPRECPARDDVVGWRYPASAGQGPFAWSATEPDWSK